MTVATNVATVLPRLALIETTATAADLPMAVTDRESTAPCVYFDF